MRVDLVLQRFRKQGGRKFQGAAATGAPHDGRFDKVKTDKRFAIGRASPSSESETSESSDSGESESELEEEEGVLGKAPEAVPTGEETRRLAVMNCDWDHISAVDILFVLQVCAVLSAVISGVGHLVSRHCVPIGANCRAHVGGDGSRSCPRRDPSSP